MVIFLSYISLNEKEPLSEEKITKFIDSFILKSPIIYILYSAADLQFIQTIDENAQSMEDLKSFDDSIFNETIIPEIAMRLLQNDLILNNLMVFLAQSLQNINEIYFITLSILLKLFKGNDVTIAEKIKFILQDPTIENPNSFNSIAKLTILSAARQKVVEIASPNVRRTVIPGKQKTMAGAPQKITYEFEFPEKVLLIPVINDKMKILALNDHFEKMLRFNFIECIYKVQKLETEKEKQKFNFEEFYYKNIYEDFINKLNEDSNSEILEFDLDYAAILATEKNKETN